MNRVNYHKHNTLSYYKYWNHYPSSFHIKRTFLVLVYSQYLLTKSIIQKELGKIMLIFEQQSSWERYSTHCYITWIRLVYLSFEFALIIHQRTLPATCTTISPIAGIYTRIIYTTTSIRHNVTHTITSILPHTKLLHI